MNRETGSQFQSKAARCQLMMTRPRYPKIKSLKLLSAPASSKLNGSPSSASRMKLKSDVFRPIATQVSFASFLVIIITLIFIQTTCSSAQQIFRRQSLPRQAPRLHQQLPPLQPPPPPPLPPQDNVVAEMQVLCHSDSIVLMVNTNAPFNGMLYAKDATNEPNCLSEFHSSTNMTFRLPLKSCGTLMAEVDDGVEFFNTIVVQPHMRLMTNQGKGYHIRCKYQTRERTIANTHFNVSAAFLMQNGPQSSTAPILATASMPMCTMKIYRIDQDNVAESVRVGDKLVMVIEIDRQDMYGMRITNCLVRDGLNKAEQLLINDAGCPVDETIMPRFEYEHNNTRAAVAFRAHKFPHTSSIYYQCNVRLCINGGGCDQLICPPTSGNGGGNQLAAASNETLASLPSTMSPSGSSTTTTTTSGGPRLKRFIGVAAQGDINNNKQQEQLQTETQAESPEAAEVSDDGGANEPSGGELPQPSELKLPADMSFDVYSGLYVSDVDMSESNAGDPSAQQVLPARPSNAKADLLGNSSSLGDASQDAPDACLTMGKASLLVVAASLTSVCLVLLVACQAGLLSTSNLDEQLDYEYLRRQHQHQQEQRASRSPKEEFVRSSKANRLPVPNYNNSNNSCAAYSNSTSAIGGRSCSPFYPMS